eukprot:6205858-Pleurochrysis_carterae.AAC.2
MLCEATVWCARVYTFTQKELRRILRPKSRNITAFKAKKATQGLRIGATLKLDVHQLTQGASVVEELKH